MHQAIFKTQYLKLVGLAFLFIGIISLSFTNLWEQKTVEEPAQLITDFSDLTMCAPTTRFKIDMADIYNAVKPLAPNLDTKWQTSLKMGDELVGCSVYNDLP